ncbi:MAG TPA: ribonuclease HII [Candidatus Paceibacterota bacterium]
MKSKEWIVGVDEVGRGPLAGPITVCLVACEEKIYKKLKLSKNLPPLGKDSKKLKERDREKYCRVLKILAKEKNLFYSVNHVSNKVIDSKGLTFAINKAISLGIKKLDLKYGNCRFLLDGSLKAPKEFKQRTIIKGDEKEKIIAWASILAKVSRDSLMVKMSKKYPEYDFHVHKGYGTKVHRSAISKNGLTSFHRVSFSLKT